MACEGATYCVFGFRPFEIYPLFFGNHHQSSNTNLREI